jgi:tRNA nucleotidyltransferase/poly(A) polymerase
MGKESDDIDIMVDNISGSQFAQLVADHLGSGRPHVIEENPDASKHLETTTMDVYLPSGAMFNLDFARARQEVYSDDSRIPQVEPATAEQDSFRRDLTINSLFYNLNTSEVEDFTGEGIKDLIGERIATPADPLKTFKDDPLRIFRTIRFASKLGWEVDPETLEAMSNPELRDDIKKKTANERIVTEWKKMLSGPNPVMALNYMKQTGLMDDIMQESLKGTDYEGHMAPLDMEQNNPHHQLTVWDHTMEVIKNILRFYPEDDPDRRLVMVLSALMHDMGKLYYKIHKPKGDRTGYGGHEDESEKIAKHILRYLKFENDLAKEVSSIARHHMRPHAFTEKGVSTDKSMRKFLRRMGEASLDWVDVLNHSIADASSKSTVINPESVAKYEALEQELRRVLQEMSVQEGSTKLKPILDGREAMQILNIQPGPQMKEIKNFISDLMDENPQITKEEASEALLAQFYHLMPDDNETTASSNPSNNMKVNAEISEVACPKHLFNKIQEKIQNAMNEGKHVEAVSHIKKMVGKYSGDSDVIGLSAFYMYPILLEDENLKDADLLQTIFSKAEKDFFDTSLCPYVFGMLVYLDTGTEGDMIEEIGLRMLKMAPEAMEKVIRSLPEKVAHPNIRDTFKSKIAAL